MFGFEHLLLVVAVLLRWSIHPVPKWVRVALARREHLTNKREREREEAAATLHTHKLKQDKQIKEE